MLCGLAVAFTGRENDGFPRVEWQDLISEMERRADLAGHLRYGQPKACGGQAAAPNLAIAAIREHLAAKSVGLHSDLQDKSSIVGNFSLSDASSPTGSWGATEHKRCIEGIVRRDRHLSFGLPEPNHGSDATFLQTTAVRSGGDWVIDRMKRLNSQVQRAHGRRQPESRPPRRLALRASTRERHHRAVPWRLPHQQPDVPSDRAARRRRAGPGVVDPRASAR